MFSKIELTHDFRSSNDVGLAAMMQIQLLSTMPYGTDSGGLVNKLWLSILCELVLVASERKLPSEFMVPSVL